jgi:predicted ATPase
MIEEFYKHLDIDPKNKQFLHYQEFMLQIHQMEHKINKKLKGKSEDTISAVGDKFSEDLLLLCIDEF